MKIQVVRTDGRVETLELAGALYAKEPEPNGQGSLQLANGMTHFFRATDGAYDGWSVNVSELNLTNDHDALAIIEQIESARVVREAGTTN